MSPMASRRDKLVAWSTVFGATVALSVCAIFFKEPILESWSAFQLERTLSRLVDQLDDEQLEKCEAAEEKLIAFGPRALAALRHALTESPSNVLERVRRCIQEIAVARQNELRPQGQLAFRKGRYTEMAHVYERLIDEGSAAFDDYVWQGHAHQLAGHWQEAARGYVRALDRLDTELDTPPAVVRQPGRISRRGTGKGAVIGAVTVTRRVPRAELLRRRSVLILLAGLIQRDLVGDREGAAGTFQRIYERSDLLNGSLAKLASDWQKTIARAREEGQPISRARAHVDDMKLYHPAIVLEQLARTQGALGQATAALETWQRFHLTTRLYTMQNTTTDATIVARLLQELPAEQQVDYPTVTVLGPESPTAHFEMNDAKVLAKAWDLSWSNSLAYWTFLLSPPPGKEFATLAFACDIEQMELRYGGQFRSWTLVGENPASRMSLGAIHWPDDLPLGRAVRKARFDIERGTGVVHFQTGSVNGKFKVHRVSVTATFRPRPDDTVEPIPGFSIQNKCLPSGGTLTHNGEAYWTDAASHDVRPGRHTYVYAHPDRPDTVKYELDLLRGGRYRLFINLDSPFHGQVMDFVGSSHDSDAASLARLPDGRWLAARSDGRIHLSSSSDLVHWTAFPQPAGQLLLGKVFRCLSPSLFVEADGTIWMSYWSDRLEVDRTGRCRLFLTHSRDGRMWSPPRLIKMPSTWKKAESMQMVVGPDARFWLFCGGSYASAERPDEIERLEPLPFELPEEQKRRAQNTRASVDADGRMHVVWHDSGATYYCRRRSNGSWEKPQLLENEGSLERPRLFVFGDRIAFFYSSDGTFLRTGRFVDGQPRFDPAIQVHEYSKSSFVYVPAEGRMALFSSSDPRSASWLLDAKVEDLFGTSRDALEPESDRG